MRTTENLADSQEEENVPTSSSVVAARSKAKAKPQPRESAGMTTIPLRERNGLILNHQSKISIRTISRRKSSIFFDTIKRYIEKKMEQLNSARKFHVRNHHSQMRIGLKELILFVENIFSAEPRILQGTKKLFHERTGRPDSEDTQEKANFEKLIMGSDTTEFVNKVKNQVRIRQKRMSSDVAENCTEHSIIWGMFMATTLNAATFMGKSYSTMRNVVQNGEKITLKQMFDITAQTIHNDEEIYCLDKIEYQRNTWTQLSLINDPVVIGLQSAKVYVFSDSVLFLGKVLQHPECNEAWKDRVAGVRAEMNYSDFDDIKGESAEFEWNIFPGFTTLQLCDKIKNLLSSLGQTPEAFT